MKGGQNNEARAGTTPFDCTPQHAPGRGHWLLRLQARPPRQQLHGDQHSQSAQRQDSSACRSQGLQEGRSGADAPSELHTRMRNQRMLPTAEAAIPLSPTAKPATAAPPPQIAKPRAASHCKAAASWPPSASSPQRREAATIWRKRAAMGQELAPGTERQPDGHSVQPT